MTGTLRGVECAGQAVAYGIKSSDTTNWLSIGLNVGLSTWLPSMMFVDSDKFCTVVLSLPFAWMVVRKVGVEEFDIVRLAQLDEADPGTPDSESINDEKITTV